MSSSSRGRIAFKGIVNAPTSCLRCSSLPHARPIARFYSAATTAATPSPAAGDSASASTSSNPVDIRSGLILTRPPLLTRTLHPFENAFFFYQKRLEERLNTPFVTDIYFKPDTPRKTEWDLKVAERKGVAKELGAFQGKMSQSWSDELKVGDDMSSQEFIVKSLLKDAEVRVSDDAEIIAEKDIVPVEGPQSRLTEADKKNDIKRLDRKLENTLYLVVKGKNGWAFPEDSVKENENLHTAAQRVLDEAAGVNMNTWIVGRVPVAHNSKGDKKTFFLKGRILAGQADVKGSPLGYTDFQWLTREELEKVLAPEYFARVRNMMADR